MTSNHINYVEFTAQNLEVVKTFYSKTFGWNFTDYGPSYVAFDHSGLEGGFELSEEPPVNGALIVIYHENLEEIMATIQSAGGTITKEIFSFPGGRRFHFKDPAGNELAVWSEQ